MLFGLNPIELRKLNQQIIDVFLGLTDVLKISRRAPNERRDEEFHPRYSDELRSHHGGGMVKRSYNIYQLTMREWASSAGSRNSHLNVTLRCYPLSAIGYPSAQLVRRANPFYMEQKSSPNSRIY